MGFVAIVEWLVDLVWYGYVQGEKESRLTLEEMVLVMHNKVGLREW